MKTLFVATALLAISLATSQASSILIDDFSIPPYSDGDQLTGSFSVDTNKVDLGWYDSGASQQEIIDQGGGDGYLQTARNYSTNTSYGISSWHSIGSLGLSTGVEYKIEFDYTYDRVGSKSYDPATIKYAIVENYGSYDQLKTLDQSAVTLNSGGSNSTILLNYGAQAGDTISLSDQTGWTTYTGTSSFTLSGSATNIGIILQGTGFGVGNSAWPGSGDYTYFGLDNVKIVTAAVPEPSSWAMLILGAVALSSVTLIRRKALA